MIAQQRRDRCSRCAAFSPLFFTLAVALCCAHAESGEAPRFAGDWATECAESAFYSSVSDVLEVVSAHQAATVGTSTTRASTTAPAISALTVRQRMWELVTQRHNVVPYTSTAVDAWDALKYLDRVKTSEAQLDLVTEIYTQRNVSVDLSGDTDGWNREHIWPKSYGVGYDGPDTSDLHALRPADWGVNSARSNRFFDVCDSSIDVGCASPAHPDAASSTAKDGVRFQPPTSVRGDIARSIFYMALRYNADVVGGVQEADTEPLVMGDCPCSGEFRMGVLSTLLAWHAADPPSERERLRSNETCAFYQRNRNPFVDVPALAEFLFSELAVEEAEAAAGGCGECASSPAQDDESNTTVAPTTTPVETTPLGPCDVVIVGFNSHSSSSEAPDSLALVNLIPLAAKTSFRVTDNAYMGSGDNQGFRNTEGVLTFTVAQGLDPGSLIYWEDGGDPTSSGGGWDKSGSFTISTSSETLIVYTVPDESPTTNSNDTSFVFALDNTPDGWEDAQSVESWSAGMGALPEPLSAAGKGWVALAPQQRNQKFELPSALRNGYSSQQLCAAVSNASNWQGSDIVWFNLNFTFNFSPETTEPPVPDDVGISDATEPNHLHSLALAATLVVSTLAVW